MSHADICRKNVAGEGTASAKAADDQEVQTLEFVFSFNVLRNVPGLEYSLSGVPL